MEAIKIDDVMTSHPVTIRADLPIWKAWKLMRENGYRHLPVLNKGQLIGIVSDRDLRRVSNSLSSDSIDVLEAMTEEPFCVDAGTPLTSVLDEMLQHKYGAALIVDEERRPLGIFTALDAIEFLYKRLKV